MTATSSSAPALPASMTAIAIVRGGGPEVLVPESRPVPQPGHRQILVRVDAAGINRHDCNQRTRGSPPAGATDIPGLEIAGTVVACGPGATRWPVGAKVCALVNGGGYAEYCIAEEVLALPWPEGFDAFQAASCPEALFTTWLNVFELAALQPGEWLLVHGGTSGVGTIAIQLARAFGARVGATAGTDEKVAFCKTLGAEFAANYKTGDFVRAATDASGGRGMDVILDMAGGRYADRNLHALAPDGRVMHLSGAGEPRYSTDVSLIMGKRARISGSGLRPYPLDRKAVLAERLARRVWPLLGTSIRPIVDTVLPLADARAAHERMEASAHTGKILLDCRPRA